MTQDTLKELGVDLMPGLKILFERAENSKKQLINHPALQEISFFSVAQYDQIAMDILVSMQKIEVDVFNYYKNQRDNP